MSNCNNGNNNFLERTLREKAHLTRERFDEHIIRGSRSSGGRVDGAHSETEFFNLMEEHDHLLTDMKEIDPPGKIYTYDYLNEKNIPKHKDTFDTDIYSEDSMFEGMNESLKNLNHEGGRNFTSRAMIKDKDGIEREFNFRGFIDEGNHRVSSMWPIQN